MADGQGDASLVRARARARPNWIAQFWYWLTATRPGRLAIWIAVGFAVAALVAFGDALGAWRPVLNTPTARIAFIGLLSLELLPLLLLLLDPAENLQNGPSIWLPATTLVLLAILAAVAVSDASIGGHFVFGYQAIGAQQIAARFSFFAYFAAVLIANIWSASNFASYEETRRKRIAESHAQKSNVDAPDESEALGALIATVGAVIVGVLAYLAGRATSPLAFENFFGLVLCAFVIGMFAIIAFLEALSETAFVQAMAHRTQSFSKHFEFLASFYDWVDAGLARIGAGVAGMGQRRVVPRYVVLAGWLTSLSLMAWFLPSPWGIVPAFVGFVLAMSVSRLWAWVESDRALAAMTEYKPDIPYRAGFREDFRDEAMLAFSFVFVLLPIAMMQAHQGHIFGPELFDRADGKSFLDWFGFFGVELAKAVPVVNWAEIYDVRDASDLIGFSSAPAKHIVFLSRVTIDLVLISALLQAIGIATRNRNQKRLYAAGHIRRFDELVEKTELNRAVRASYRRPQGEAKSHFDLGCLGKNDIVDFTRYDETRLKTVYWASKDTRTRDFIRSLVDASAGKIQLSTAMDLVRDIASTTRKASDMSVAFERALEEHRNQIRVIDFEDLYGVLFDLRRFQSLGEFKFQVIDTAVSVATPEVALTELSDFAGGPLADYQYVRRYIASVMPALIVRTNGIFVLEEVLAKWEGWSHDDRPHGPEYGAVVKALRDRIQLLRKSH